MDHSHKSTSMSRALPLLLCRHTPAHAERHALAAVLAVQRQDVADHIGALSRRPAVHLIDDPLQSLADFAIAAPSHGVAEDFRSIRRLRFRETTHAGREQTNPDKAAASADAARTLANEFRKSADLFPSDWSLTARYARWADAVEHLAAEIDRMKAIRWTCFHCGATFTGEQKALEHFGPYAENVNSPACTSRHAKMYRWLRKHSFVSNNVIEFGVGFNQTRPELLDAAITARIEDGERRDFLHSVAEAAVKSGAIKCGVCGGPYLACECCTTPPGRDMNADLLAALERAADTFQDLSATYGRSAVAAACKTAETDARAALARAMPVSDSGGPAFPSPGVVLQDGQQQGAYDGMALRDYFAAKAMQAYIAEYFKANGPCFGTSHLTSNLPMHSYEMADAMLAARAK